MTVAATSPSAIGRPPEEQPAIEHAQAVAAYLFGTPRDREFVVRYWTGVEDRSRPGKPAFTVVLRHPGALRRLCTPLSELSMARAIVDGDIDVEGNLEAAVAWGNLQAVRFASPAALSRLALIAARLPADHHAHDDGRYPVLRRHGSRHSLRRDRESVRAHYDLGNDFYRLWLDRSLTYSCGYFKTGAEDIDTAQVQKLDHLCRKLRLAPGERLLDVGCGWGALVRHAAQHYGVQALGVTLSEHQARWARARIQEAGLAERCHVEVRDYREPLTDTPFDKIVSVGMFEHVGRDYLPEYFARIFHLLKPGGVFLNHGIIEMPKANGSSWHHRLLWRRGAFIDRYVFPDGELVPLSVALEVAEAAGFEARDVETLREHYVLTLRHWVHRLEQRRTAIESVAGPRIYRTWRLYMSASAHAFASGRLSLAQIVFGRQDDHGRVGLPLTRGDLYRAAA